MYVLIFVENVWMSQKVRAQPFSVIIYNQDWGKKVEPSDSLHTATETRHKGRHEHWTLFQTSDVLNYN